MAERKPEILRELADVLAASAGASDAAEEIFAAIMRREAVLSTGVGNGIALPHARCAAVGDMAMAVGTTSRPVDFESLDGRPVRLVWMLVGPERTAGRHVRTLARISELLRPPAVRETLIEARDPEQFLSRLAAAEHE